MSDEIKLLKQRDLGARAKRLREDQLLSQIFEGLKAEYIREWAGTDLLDNAAREQRYLQLHALLDVRAQMNAILSTGETAAKFLEHAEKFKA
jgi:hypothetical protein